ncbi:MAG: outer membrane protein assembly factor BamC [Gammaproteobacteria bacterium]|jgi:outer membrane protein assembly factor BamC
MKFPSMAIQLAIITLVFVGCSSSQDLRYLDSRTAEKLEIPPDLTVTTQADDIQLPANFSTDSDDSKALKKIPVLVKVDSIKLEGRGDFHWLSVDEPVDNLYQLVKNFWSSEGYEIKIDEPVIGLLQTEWTFGEEGSDKKDTSFLMKFFTSDDLSATQNQFRTRIERDAETGTGRIYISHRGTAYEHILQTKKNEDIRQNEWQLVPPNSEFEVEMLSRLMIYLGLQQAERDEQLANMKLFAPLASIHADYAQNETYLLVKDSYSKTWHRTLHQLDRMNIEVVSSSFDSVLRTKGLIRVKTNVEEEATVGGFLSFGGETKMVKKQLILVITEESHNVTRISMQTPEGEIESSNEGVEFLTLLYQFLK